MGERGPSSSRPDNGLALLRGVSTGVLDSPGTLTFVLMVVRRYKHPENINPAIACGLFCSGAAHSLPVGFGRLHAVENGPGRCGGVGS